ncbi:MAG: integrase arm-type DNA-binding domain-containing protein, partial [Desulfovibrionaceae bacterium]|nr:integrase arm-type DNA-binding domain-containing protein [Desulfovibrionaceae bacterium]
MLTDVAIRNAKAEEKPRKLFDSNGLYLLISTSGTKGWRLKYRFQGKEKLISLGRYPLVSLKEARERAMEARKKLESGSDPSVERKLKKQAAENTFELVAREWYELQKPKWSAGYANRVIHMLTRNLFPFIGSRPIAEITAPEILVLLRKVEARGIIATAHALKYVCSNIMRYAIATGRAERDPAADLRGALKPNIKKHRPALTNPEKVGRLMHSIYHYTGSLVVRSALQLLALTFCRSNEIRYAQWNEFDFEERLWRIPAERMKMNRDHLVPLSDQTMAVLEKMREYTGGNQYVFPSYHDESKPFGNSALRRAMQSMGFEKEEMCPHGFRTMASTLLNELGYNRDWIERQLAPVPQEQVRGIYNRAEYLP